MRTNRIYETIGGGTVGYDRWLGKLLIDQVAVDGVAGFDSGT